MSIKMNPETSSTIYIKNKLLNVEVTYSNDVTTGMMQGRKLKWEIDNSTQNIAEFQYPELSTDTHGKATNFLRPLAGAKPSDKITFNITDITDPANEVKLGSTTYIYEDILLSLLPDVNNAYSTFSDIANISNAEYCIELTVTVNDAKPDGTTGNLKKNAKVYFNTRSPSVQFFSKNEKNNQLKSDENLGFPVTTEKNGTAKIYLGAIMPGIFEITASYYSGSNIYERGTSIQVIFLDTDPGGSLPPLFLPSDINNVLNLDEYNGNYYPVNLPSNLTSDHHFYEYNTSGAIILNNKVVKIGNLKSLINGVSLKKSSVLAGKDNSIYYLLTNEMGDSFSSVIQNFTVAGEMLYPS